VRRGLAVAIVRWMKCLNNRLAHLI
jgi:hypothetical protein